MPKIEITLPEESFARLERLKERIEAGSHSEVFSNALRLYEASVEEVEQGGTIVVIRLDGSQMPVFESVSDE